MWKCKYIETSAKVGTNVTELFEELLKLDTTRQLSLQPIEKTETKNGMQKMKEKCTLMWRTNGWLYLDSSNPQSPTRLEAKTSAPPFSRFENLANEQRVVSNQKWPNPTYFSDSWAGDNIVIETLSIISERDRNYILLCCRRGATNLMHKESNTFPQKIYQCLICIHTVDNDLNHTQLWLPDMFQRSLFSPWKGMEDQN